VKDTRNNQQKELAEPDSSGKMVLNQISYSGSSSTALTRKQNIAVNKYECLVFINNFDNYATYAVSVTKQTPSNIT